MEGGGRKGGRREGEGREGRRGVREGGRDGGRDGGEGGREEEGEREGTLEKRERTYCFISIGHDWACGRQKWSVRSVRLNNTVLGNPPRRRTP